MVDKPPIPPLPAPLAAQRPLYYTEPGADGLRHYDRDGIRISLWESMVLSANREDVVVRQTRIGDFKISTVWLSVDHNFLSSFSGSDEPLIFETMIFGPGEEFQERYCTEAEALERHAELVDFLTLRRLKDDD